MARIDGTDQGDTLVGGDGNDTILQVSSCLINGITSFFNLHHFFMFLCYKNEYM